MVDVDAFKARIGNERFPYVSGIEARELVAMIERLQREAAAGRVLYEVVDDNWGIYTAEASEAIRKALDAYDKAVANETT